MLRRGKDGSALLFGEAKWSETRDVDAQVRALAQKVDRFPDMGGRAVVLALWLKHGGRSSGGAEILAPVQVLHALR